MFLIISIGSISVISSYFFYYLYSINYDRRIKVEQELTKIDNEFYETKEVKWWDFSEKESFEALKGLTPIRANFFNSMFEKFEIEKKSQILEIGSGGGFVTEALAEKGYKMKGIDLSEKSVTEANLHAKTQNFLPECEPSYSVGDAYDLSRFEDLSLDAVVIADVLEHLNDLPFAVSEISRVLRPGGVIVFDTINRTVSSYIFAILLAQDLKLVKGTFAHCHDWSLFITPKELQDIFKSNNLQLKEIKGLESKISVNNIIEFLSGKFISPNFELTNNKNVQYIGCAVKQ